MNCFWPRICKFWCNVLVLFYSKFMTFASFLCSWSAHPIFFVRTAVRQNCAGPNLWIEWTQMSCADQKIYNRKAPWPLTWQIIFIRLCAEHKTKYEGNGARDDDKIKVRTRELVIKASEWPNEGRDIHLSLICGWCALCVCWERCPCSRRCQVRDGSRALADSIFPVTRVCASKKSSSHRRRDNIQNIYTGRSTPATREMCLDARCFFTLTAMPFRKI